MGRLIEIKNLTVRYEENFALRGINLEISKGERIGIAGPNGAGKSTLLLAIKGLIEYEGEVIYYGITSKEVGIVFQNPDIQLFMPTVLDDVAFGPLNQGLTGDEVLEKVKWALESVGLVGFEKRSPHHLSEGEKRKVSIATILSMNPEVYLFDEPTNGLDPQSRGEILDLICRIDKTVLIATHDIEILKSFVDRVIILNSGLIVEDGNVGILEDTEVLLKNRLIYQRECENV